MEDLVKAGTCLFKNITGEIRMLHQLQSFITGFMTYHGTLVLL